MKITLNDPDVRVAELNVELADLSSFLPDAFIQAEYERRIGFPEPEIIEKEVPADVDTAILSALAGAIRRGDVAEAELQLDRLAADVGDAATHAVGVARYAGQARMI